jgi:hydrogenase expression/formation protein HypD
MRYLDEYREGGLAQAIAREIAACATRRWVLMEVCGGQTHSIVRYGLDRLVPAIELVHGPGCPVCVTALETIDRAHSIASRPEVIFASFGDMLRVPGSRSDLLRLRSRGADVRVVYSPLDAVRLARESPGREVVFFGIGFETTAPANAMAIVQAHRERLRNFSVLLSHVLVPPAMESILQGEEHRVQAFLGPGHVCAIMGTREYQVISARHRVPIVVSGFEPIDLLHGMLMCIRQLEAGRAEVENQYARTVSAEGNLAARTMMGEVFEIGDRNWRGLGVIPNSGLRIRKEYGDFDAEQKFTVNGLATHESPLCISGLILQGLKRPSECPAFGRECSPGTPLGATMVSSEGACAAYFHYGRRDTHLDSQA